MAILDWARAEPKRTIVLAGIGFETTACAIAAVMREAVQNDVRNIRLLSAVKTMPAALRALVQDEDTHLDGLILPGHVMTITGTDAFQFLSEEFRIPCAVSGFEPADLLSSILSIVTQISESSPRMDIEYSRSVRREGNRHAQRMIDQMFEACAMVWRGLGKIPDSGLRLRSHYAAWDASALVRARPRARSKSGCRCGDVLRGRLRPGECPMFGTACTPETPQGACMVSSEGACAAVFQFAPVHG
jgi:hydrogenase expression/formation protein HypD